MSDYDKILSDAGFTQYASCNSCGGKKKLKYRVNSTVWEVWVLPGRGTFFLIRANKAIKGAKLSQLNEVIEQYKSKFHEAIWT